MYKDVGELMEKNKISDITINSKNMTDSWAGICKVGNEIIGSKVFHSESRSEETDKYIFGLVSKMINFTETFEQQVDLSGKKRISYFICRTIPLLRDCNVYNKNKDVITSYNIEQEGFRGRNIFQDLIFLQTVFIKSKQTEENQEKGEFGSEFPKDITQYLSEEEIGCFLEDIKGPFKRIVEKEIAGETAPIKITEYQNIATISSFLKEKLELEKVYDELKGFLGVTEKPTVKIYFFAVLGLISSVSEFSTQNVISHRTLNNFPKLKELVEYGNKISKVKRFNFEQNALKDINIKELQKDIGKVFNILEEVKKNLKEQIFKNSYEEKKKYYLPLESQYFTKEKQKEILNELKNIVKEENLTQVNEGVECYLKKNAEEYNDQVSKEFFKYINDEVKTNLQDSKNAGKLLCTLSKYNNKKKKNKKLNKEKQEQKNESLEFESFKKLIDKTISFKKEDEHIEYTETVIDETQEFIRDLCPKDNTTSFVLPQTLNKVSSNPLQSAIGKEFDIVADQDGRVRLPIVLNKDIQTVRSLGENIMIDCIDDSNHSVNKEYLKAFFSSEAKISHASRKIQENSLYPLAIKFLNIACYEILKDILDVKETGEGFGALKKGIRHSSYTADTVEGIGKTESKEIISLYYLVEYVQKFRAKEMEPLLKEQENDKIELFLNKNKDFLPPLSVNETSFSLPKILKNKLEQTGLLKAFPDFYKMLESLEKFDNDENVASINVDEKEDSPPNKVQKLDKEHTIHGKILSDLEISSNDSSDSELICGGMETSE